SHYLSERHRTARTGARWFAATIAPGFALPLARRHPRDLHLLVIRRHGEEGIVLWLSFDAGHLQQGLGLAVFELSDLEREGAALDELGGFGIGLELRFHLVAVRQVLEQVEDAAGLADEAEIPHPFGETDVRFLFFAEDPMLTGDAGDRLGFAGCGGFEILG